jgi:hypothetical protein
MDLLTLPPPESFQRHFLQPEKFLNAWSTLHVTDVEVLRKKNIDTEKRLNAAQRQHEELAGVREHASIVIY